MDFIVENSAAAVIDKISFNDLLTFTLFRDGQSAVSRREKKLGVSGGGDDESRFNSMRISELLQEAHEKGFNVDGSREMLIAALKAVQEAEVDSEEDSEESDDEPEETWGIACYFSIPNSKAQMIHSSSQDTVWFAPKEQRGAPFLQATARLSPQLRYHQHSSPYAAIPPPTVGCYRIHHHEEVVFFRRHHHQ
jgi:hypothetical protein